MNGTHPTKHQGLLVWEKKEDTYLFNKQLGVSATQRMVWSWKRGHICNRMYGKKVKVYVLAWTFAWQSRRMGRTSANIMCSSYFLWEQCHNRIYPSHLLKVKCKFLVWVLILQVCLFCRNLPSTFQNICNIPIKKDNEK